MSQPTLFTLAASPPPATTTKEPPAALPPPASAAKNPTTARTRPPSKRQAKKFDYGRGRKIKTVRRDNGRHSFLVLFQDAVLYLSPVTFPSAADAGSAGKTFLYSLPDDWLQRRHPVDALDGQCHRCLERGKAIPADWLQRRHPVDALDGQCHRCLERGKAIPAVNSGRSSLCRPCWQQLHPGQLEKWEEGR